MRSLRARSLWRVTLGCLIVPVFGCRSQPTKPVPSPIAAEAGFAGEHDAFAHAVEQAYLIGFPAVEIERTRRVMTNTEAAGEKMAPTNQFAHANRLVTAADREVVTPNNDTPYSNAFLDLAEEPLVLHLPAFGDRYFVVPFLSAYHEHFASIGQRTRAAKGEQVIAAPQGGDFLIKGPGFKGEPPAGMPVVHSPTNAVWVIMRPLLRGPDDVETLSQLKSEIWLRPLSQYRNADYVPSVVSRVESNEQGVPLGTPVTGRPFFEILAGVVAKNPPTGPDATLLTALGTIGIRAEQHFAVPQWTNEQLTVVERASADAVAKIERAVAGLGRVENGWTVLSGTQGLFHGDHLRRAAYSLVGLGVINSAEAIYPMGTLDAAGNELNGANDYTLHFEKGELPPAGAFWSLSMYGADRFFVENELNRFSIGDRSGLVFNDDGSLTLYLQHENPGAQKQANWLPSPKGKFYVVLRIYLPEERVLSGEYKLPAIQLSRP